MNLFKSKLRRRIETKIVELQKAVATGEAELMSKGIKQTLNPKEYAHYSCIISDLKSDINLLQSIL